MWIFCENEKYTKFFRTTTTLRILRCLWVEHFSLMKKIKNQQIIKTHARHIRRVIYWGRHDDHSRFFIFLPASSRSQKNTTTTSAMSTIKRHRLMRRKKWDLLVMMNQHWDHLNMYKVEIARRQLESTRLISFDFVHRFKDLFEFQFLSSLVLCLPSSWKR